MLSSKQFKNNNFYVGLNLKRKKCANCHFLKQVSNDGGSHISWWADEIDRKTIWLAKEISHKHYECHYNIWVNQSDDVDFLKEYRCENFLHYSKYPHATFPAADQLVRNKSERWRWRMMFFAALLSAISAFISADLHLILLNLFQ